MCFISSSLRDLLMRLALTDLYQSDFPSLAISKYGIEAQHPDEFLRHLFDLALFKFTHTVEETRLSLKYPPKTIEEYLIILEKQSLPQTVICLKEYAGLFNANCA